MHAVRVCRVSRIDGALGIFRSSGEVLGECVGTLVISCLSSEFR